MTATYTVRSTKATREIPNLTLELAYKRQRTRLKMKPEAYR